MSSDPEALLLARVYEVILGWPETVDTDLLHKSDLMATTPTCPPSRVAQVGAANAAPAKAEAP